MKKFEILRYLKRFSLLIFLVSLAGAAAIYLYADGRQKYTASVIIRYTTTVSRTATPRTAASWMSTRSIPPRSFRKPWMRWALPGG